jgi:hypothetical protein
VETVDLSCVLELHNLPELKKMRQREIRNQKQAKQSKTP